MQSLKNDQSDIKLIPSFNEIAFKSKYNLQGSSKANYTQFITSDQGFRTSMPKMPIPNVLQHRKIIILGVTILQTLEKGLQIDPAMHLLQGPRISSLTFMLMVSAIFYPVSPFCGVSISKVEPPNAAQKIIAKKS